MGISKLAWTGVAREATSGTAITTPTVFVPTKATFKATKKREYFDEERGDRNANYNVVDSIRQSAIDIKGAWYNDVHPYFLIAAMGAEAPTQPAVGTDPTVWLHTLSLANVPPSLTVFRNLDVVCYYTPYTVIEKFSLKFDAEGKMLEFDANGVGIWPVVKASPPSPTYSTLSPFAGYTPTITLDSVASSDINSFTMNFEQKVTLWYPANGSQDFITAYFGERKVSFDFTARFDAATFYAAKLLNATGATTSSLSISFNGPIISHTYAQNLTFGLPAISYDAIEHDLGKDNILLKVKGMALAQTTQFLTATVQNTVASYTV